MKTIIHDLDKKNLKKLKFNDCDYIIDANTCKYTCIGCFSCWIKHPKKCIYKDSYSNMADILKNTDELIIISKSRYGCYSSSIKRVLERSIGYVLPYFTIRNNMIHHLSRYDKKLKITALFYGDINELDKENLYNLVKANSINFNASSFDVKYFKEIKNVYID